MISFIILADGPSAANSFRPNDDETQWWSRRDALVRMTNMACYYGRNIVNPTTDELIIFFNELSNPSQHEKKVEIIEEGRNSANRQTYNTAVMVMEPKLMINDIAVPCEYSIIKAWRNAFQKAEHTRQYLLGGLNPELSGIQCSYHAWTEALSLTRTIVTSDLGGKRTCEFTDVHSRKRMKTADVHSLDKKELIKWLQSSCSIEFLRENHLNASEAIILKKFNKEKLTGLYHLWVESHRNLKSCNSVDSPDDNGLDMLVQTFLVLLARCCKVQYQSGSNTRCTVPEGCFTQTTILVLHEDYPHELPVFGSSFSKDQVPHKVICVLGGVRDAYNDEIKALFIAAKNLGIRCVGANLGRTAEFTSKIIAAMSAHAAVGRLVPAVETLPSVSLADGAIIPKLLSIRKGNSTWDGHRKLSSRALLTVEEPVVSPLSDNRKLMKIVAPICFASSALMNDSMDRDTLQPFIQLVVNAIWKSRMISEIEESEDGVLDCVLDLCFSDGLILHLCRTQVAKEIARLHMAAPSEFQILLLVKNLLSNDSNISRSSVSNEDEMLTMSIKSALPNNLTKFQKKKWLSDTTVYHIVGLQAIKHSGRNMAPSNSHLVAIPAISTEAYSSKCSCNDHAAVSPKSPGNFIIILDGDASSAQKIEHNFQILVKAFCSWKYPDSTVADDAKYLKFSRKLHSKILTRRVVDVVSETSLAFAVSIMQHFAYHDKLV